MVDKMTNNEEVRQSTAYLKLTKKSIYESFVKRQWDQYKLSKLK